MKIGRLPARMHTILNEGVRHHVTPGLAADVSISTGAGANSLDFWLGKLDFGVAHHVDENTIYDLASLTKMLSTTLLSAVAIDLGKLDLDEKPWPLWPGVSVAQVLGHTAGIVPWLPLYQEAIAKGVFAKKEGAELIVRAAQHVKPVAVPGKILAYSDIGYIVLGRLLEQRLRDRIDVLFYDAARRFFGATKMQYVCLYERHHHPQIDQVAPTGKNPWIGRVLRGQVHDPNSYAMGGISGHAGLFGNLNDIKRAAAFFLAALKGNATGVPQILRQFASFIGPRPLGFDKPDRNGSTAGALSALSIGHLGFTGTSVWIDPLAANGIGAFYILLTNRVCANAENKKGILGLRLHFHRTASQWVKANTARHPLAMSKDAS